LGINPKLIDTIKLKLATTKEQEKILARKGTSAHGWEIDRPGQFTYFRYTIPSYFSGINVYSREGIGKIEFSVPKNSSLQCNLLMVRPDDVKQVVDQAVLAVEREIGEFASYMIPELVRLDICWNFVANSQEEAEDIYKNFRQQKQTKFIYEVRQNYTMKMYLKYQEFKKHDFKIIAKDNPGLALDLLEQSKGMIRFETELRLKQLQKEFDKSKIYLEDISDQKIKLLIDKYMGKLNLSFVENKDLEQKLIEMYGNEKGNELIEYLPLLGFKKVPKLSVRKWYKYKRLIRAAKKLIPLAPVVVDGKFSAPA